MNVEVILKALEESDDHQAYAFMERKLADDSEDNDSAALAELVAALGLRRDANPNHYPAGSNKGGQFASKLPEFEEDVTQEVINQLPEEARTEKGAANLFHEKLAALHSKGELSFYHEVPNDMIASVKSKGIEGTYGVFAAINESSDYVTSKTKTIVQFQVPSSVLPDIGPDMRYGGLNSIGLHQRLLLEHPTLKGAYVSISTENIPSSWFISVKKVTKDANPNHIPAGSSKGGQFAPKSGGGSSIDPKDVPSHEDQVKQHEDLKGYFNMLDGFRRKSGAIPEGTDSVESFVLKHGQPYFVNAKTFEGKRDKPKMCYMNAAKVVLEDPDRTYVEGYITTFGVPLMHAWTVDKSGQVYDSTIVPKDGRIAGYYGVPFARKYLLECLNKNKYYGLLGYVSQKTLIPLLQGKTTNFKAGG